jgi:predicted nucleotidyltransferase
VIGQIERVLAALNDARVRYLVVGGVAVVLHGHLRVTADLDLVVQLEQENLRRALRALADLGYQPRAPVPIEAFADPENRRRWIEEKNLQVFSLWHKSPQTFEVDLFVTEPLDFDVAYSRAVRVQLESTEIPVVSQEDLIQLKRNAGRPADLEDIRALEVLRKEAGDDEDR